MHVKKKREPELEFERSQSLAIAKQLGYSAKILEMIKQAATSAQISQAMVAGRRGFDTGMQKSLY